MENKYYTPEISDIRVGYECFWIKDHNKNLTDDNLIPIKFTPKQLSSTIFPPLNWEREFTDEYSPNLMSYVTPYLTKEQIEAEGFKFDKDNYGVLEFSKWETEIRFRPADEFGYHWLNIFKTGTKPPTELYYGKCPSINEFRMICKLLGI